MSTTDIWNGLCEIERESSIYHCEIGLEKVPKKIKRERNAERVIVFYLKLRKNPKSNEIIMIKHYGLEYHYFFWNREMHK